MLHLPLLEPHRDALEKCVYCPKLSRAACPVANVEANETVTPWGKMSMAYFAARGDVPVDKVHAESAWACSACYACRERCDHKNEVATVLADARAEHYARGAAPAAAVEVASRFAERTAEAARTLGEIAPDRMDERLPAVLVGCSYARHAPEVARDALLATRALVGGPVRPLLGCCGLPLLHAGDRAGFLAAARKLLDEIEGAPRLVAVDPGCARALLVEYPRLGVVRTGPDGAPRTPAPELFVDLALAKVDALRPVIDTDDVRYHDPCQLGRGLGRYDEPRTLLARATGKAPAEFQRSRLHAECSGGGGLLPVTRPETSAAMADARIAEHQRLGGGLVVTACGESLRRFRSRGEHAMDLVTVIARSLGVAPAPAAKDDAG